MIQDKHINTRRWMLMMTFVIIQLPLFLTSIEAQSWASKAAKSVFTLKTFAPDGSLIASSTGFFVSEKGDAISVFTPFINAQRAVIIDASGKEYAVDHILGANEMYDVVKFHVASKNTDPLVLSTTKAANGSEVWMLPYSTKKPNGVKGTVQKSETIMEQYAYYTLSLSMTDNAVGSPLLNASGQVIGMMQPAAQSGSNTNYAISAAYVNSLSVNGFSHNDATLKKTHIKIALPKDKDQARLALYMAGNTMNSTDYAELVEDYIKQFPDAADGYITRAQLNVYNDNFAAADADMQKAVSISDALDDTYYNYARIIYQKEIYKQDKPYEAWSLDKALEHIHRSNEINPQTAYTHLEAQILFAKKKYIEADQLFEQLLQTDLRSAELFYENARCKEMLADTTAQLALLDSAVNANSRPFLREAAPYIWARATALFNTGKYRQAVADFNEYEKLIGNNLNANFYYIREQAELNGRQFQQALDDIKKATEMAPDDFIYWAERASLEIRVSLTDDAIRSAQTCINVAPDESDGYLFLGLAQCLKNNKTVGLKNLNIAKEKGNEQADALIQKYAQ